MDSKVDEGEIPKAVVNSFSFTPDSLKVTPAAGVKGLPPDLVRSVLQQALEALKCLHEKNKLHAGIRPADTTASRRPRWKTSSVATPPGPDM